MNKEIIKYLILGILIGVFSILPSEVSWSTARETMAKDDFYSKPNDKGPLRLDWSNLPPISPLAQEISAAQQQQHLCDNADSFKFWKHQGGGMGQNLHTWAQSLCAAQEQQKVLFATGPWGWMDQGKCKDVRDSPMLCYFGDHVSASHCSKNRSEILSYRNKTEKQGFEICPRYMNKERSVNDFMSAAMEYLFQSVRPIVITEAEKQIREAFPDGLPNPEDMITVHMRWGDKSTETSLLPVEWFVNGAKHLANARERPSNPVHIYLASEDIDAINAFANATPSEWIIHTTGPTQTTTEKNMVAFMSGERGLESLAALLISLQSNHYVLVTASNWSRLINELRSNVLDPRCQNCTNMLDLHPGEWPTLGSDGSLSWSSEFGKPVVDLETLAQ